MIKYGKEEAQLMKEITGYGLKCEAPVYEIDFDWFGSDNPLPDIWITERVVDDDGKLLGRTYVMLCDSDFEALKYGCGYYNEGLEYTDASDHNTRIECFEAAEILYLRAASVGNVIAYRNLGYLYRYDRCEGSYFVDCREAETEKDYQWPYTCEQRAFECFSYAAEHDDAESCYELGDLYREGIGCKPSAKEAFSWYARANSLVQAKDDRYYEPYVWGSIAYRLGSCYENGFGCTQDFKKALKWYEQAETGLEIAVDSGDWLYERTLSNVRSSLKRIKQELSGCY